MCDEFSCLPSEAYAEWQRLPVGMLEEIIEARHYARAKQAIEGATGKEAREAVRRASPLATLADEIEFEVVRDARNAG